MIVVGSAFEKPPFSSRLIHGLSLLSIALAVVLLITPAALHRIVWSGEENETVLRTGSRITILALLPLALGMAGDAYVVLARITGATMGAAIAAGIVLLVLLGFWYVWPLADRLRLGGRRTIRRNHRVLCDRNSSAIPTAELFRALASHEGQPETSTPATTVEAEQRSCGRYGSRNKNRPARRIQRLLPHPPGLLLGMPGRRARSQQAEDRSDHQIDTKQNESGRNGLNAQPQSLPSGDLGQRQDGQRKDESDRTKRRAAALTRHHGP